MSRDTMPTDDHGGRAASGWRRRALVGAVVGIAVTLVFTAWSSVRTLRDASRALARGQGETLLRELDMAMRDRPGTPQAALAALVAAQAPSGLRYVALYGPRGEKLHEAGVAAAPTPRSLRTDPGLEPGTLLDLGGRFLLVGRLPPPDGDRAGRDRPPPPEGRRAGPLSGEDRRGERPGPPGPGPAGRGGGPRGGPAAVVEFEPSTVQSLSRRVERTLIFGALAAGLLLAAAVTLGRLEAERERALQAVERHRRLSALGEMSAVLAHEIRTPLATLKGHAQLLEEQLPGDGAAGRKARHVVTAAHRLERLVDDLLELTRAGPIDRRPTDLGTLLAECAAELDPARIELRFNELISGAGKRGTADSAPQQVAEHEDMVVVDASRLRQILLNLLRNGLEASPPDRPVELTASRTTGSRTTGRAGRLRFIVRDHGQGFAPGDEERVFEPFYTTRTQGVGLGLAVARRIAGLHGGSLVARNHPDGGAELVLEIAEVPPAVAPAGSPRSGAVE